jgi:hypothetical protein
VIVSGRSRLIVPVFTPLTLNFLSPPAFDQAGLVWRMSSKYQVERNRGTKEARQQLAVLREKWPLAFPAKLQDVRPLAIGPPAKSLRR